MNEISKIELVKVLAECGNRVYKFKGELPNAGWIRFGLGKFKDERQLFFNVEDDTVLAIAHKCPNLPEDARYVWQGRLYTPPKLPAACPRCRYRLDYVSKRGV